MKRNKMRLELETDSTDIQLCLAVNMYCNSIYCACIVDIDFFFFK